MASSGRSRQRGGVGGWVVFAIGFAVYAATASPSLFWLDSPEFVAAAASLGVAHSPGHPLVAFLGHVATLVPIGDIVWRVNLMSALIGAAALAALWSAGRRLAVRVAPAASPAAASAMAGALALVVGFSWAVWSSAVRAEVYALQLLLSAAIVAAVIAYDAAPARRPLLLAGLCGGLALANHHLMAVLLLLPAAAVVLARPRTERPSWAAAGWTAALGLVGLCALLYLPVRAMDFPEPNFGNPSTPERFAWTVSGAAFSKTAAAEHVSPPAVDAAQVTVAVFEGATVPLALLALFGLYLGLRRPGWRRLALGLAGVALAAGAGRVVFGFDPETPDHHAYLTTAVVAVALLGLGGLAVIVQLLASAEPPRRTAGAVAAAALALLAAVQAWDERPEASLAGAWAGSEVARWEIEQLPPRALLLPAYFQTSFRLSALRAVEHARPDVAILDRSFLTYPGMVEDAIHRHPELAELIRAPLVAGAPTPVPRLRDIARERPVYVQLHPNLDAAALAHLRPAGPFAAFAPGAPAEPWRARDAAARADLAARLAAAAAPAEAHHVAAALLWHDATRLHQYCELGDRAAAAAVAEAALALAPDDRSLRALAACGDTPPPTSH